MSDRDTVVSMAPREHAKLVRGAGDPLVITVEPISAVLHNRGNYGHDGKTLPVRYRFAHPQAHASMLRLEADYPYCIYYSDMFRNASGSKGRRRKNRDKRVEKGLSAIHTGLLPGSSGHGFGMCADHMVSANLRRLRVFLEDPEFDKEDYDLLMRGYGWYCHRDGPRGDHKRGSEEFHYNYFGDDPDRWLAHSNRRTSGGLEAKLNYKYGPFTLDAAVLPAHLTELGYDAGRLTDAVKAFQSDWTMVNAAGVPDGIAGPQTQRVLLYVGATFRDGDGNDVDVPFP